MKRKEHRTEALLSRAAAKAAGGKVFDLRTLPGPPPVFTSALIRRLARKTYRRVRRDGEHTPLEFYDAFSAVADGQAMREAIQRGDAETAAVRAFGVAVNVCMYYLRQHEPAAGHSYGATVRSAASRRAPLLKLGAAAAKAIRDYRRAGHRRTGKDNATSNAYRQLIEEAGGEGEMNTKDIQRALRLYLAANPQETDPRNE